MVDPAMDDALVLILFLSPISYGPGKSRRTSAEGSFNPLILSMRTPSA
jgi:hypothetical protein